MVMGKGLSLAVSIGGVVASSLPSSLKATSRELDSLASKAAEDRTELRRLSGQLKRLEKDSDEYNATAAKVDELKQALAETGEQQRALVVEQRRLQEEGADTGRSLRSVGVAAGFMAAGVIGGALAVNSMSERLRSFSVLSARTGRTVEDLDRASRDLGVALGDTDLGRAAITALAELNQQGRALQSDFGAAGLAGIDVDTLRRGELTLRDVQMALRDIADEQDRTLAAQRTEALFGLVGADVLQAAHELGNVSDETLRLRQAQVRLNDSILETRDAISRGLVPALEPVFRLGAEAAGGVAHLASAAQGVVTPAALAALAVGGVFIAMRTGAAIAGLYTSALGAVRTAYVGATAGAIGFNAATGGALIGLGLLASVALPFAARRFGLFGSAADSATSDGRRFAGTMGDIQSVADRTGIDIDKLLVRVRGLRSEFGEVAKADLAAQLEDVNQGLLVGRGTLLTDAIRAGFDPAIVRNGRITADELGRVIDEIDRLSALGERRTAARRREALEALPFTPENLRVAEREREIGQAPVLRREARQTLRDLGVLRPAAEGLLGFDRLPQQPQFIIPGAGRQVGPEQYRVDVSNVFNIQETSSSEDLAREVIRLMELGGGVRRRQRAGSR